MPLDMPPANIWTSLEHSAVATFVRESVWAYPILETVHIVGLGLLFGAIVSFDLRVLGLSKSLPVTTLERHLLPWVWVGFALNAASGTLLFASDAVDFSANPALMAKLALIAAAGANALVFQRRIAAGTAGWQVDRPASPAARLSAALSIALWLAVIIAGRMIAYVK
ncbi:MAG: hypothetical protein ACT4N2_00485 [Hyphomicrobium sp.]